MCTPPCNWLFPKGKYKYEREGGGGRVAEKRDRPTPKNICLSLKYLLLLFKGAVS
jgi:hypothetical protein